MGRIVKYILLDILKNKTILFYSLLLAMLSWGVFSLEDNQTKGVLTILNVILLTVPLVSVIFSTIYIYNSSQFIELLLSQPIKRNRIWIGLYLGLATALVLSYLIAAGIPILIFAEFKIAITLILSGCLMSMVFASLAFLCSMITRDKAKGIGLSIMLWLYFAILFDGIVLFLMFQFSEYPIEKAMIGLTMLSPLDLSRILILLDLDVSAMMGYTGAIFKNFLGTKAGIFTSYSVLVLWILIPFMISLKKFTRSDL